MSDNYSDLDLEGAAEPCQDTSFGYVESVSVAAGESVARAQLTGPMGMREAFVSSEGAVSAAGSGNILGNKRIISEVTEMSEEEKSLRGQIDKKNDQIEGLTGELRNYKDKLETIEGKVAYYEKLCDDNPNDAKMSNRLERYGNEKIGMDRKISETTANLTQKERDLAKLNDKLEIFLKGMLNIWAFINLFR